MTPREYWSKYVAEHGGPKGVAERTRIPYSTIAGVCNGSRGIGDRLLKRLCEADSELDEHMLVWVRPLKNDAEAA